LLNAPPQPTGYWFLGRRGSLPVRVLYS